MLLQRAAMESSGRSSGGDRHDPVLPPGYRFYPTEEELLGFYLRHRLAGTRPQVEHFIPVVDIYGHHPSDLRAMAGAANVGDKEQWFFFCPRAERELSGGRPARTTPTGYWKATGSPSYVYSAAPDSSRVVGEKRTMVFYEGRAPTGAKTRWKMNEYKAVAAAGDADAPPPGAPVRLRNEFSVCRVYTSNGTLRSFDRRPLNPPPGGGLDDRAAAAHRRYQQQEALPPPPPPAAAASNQMAALDVVAAAANGQSSEHSHSHGSSSSSGSLGAVVDGAAIDWDALIPPVDYLRLSADDLSHVVWPPN